MTAGSKQRTEQHIIDACAQDLFRASIPKHWVIRDYRPDYGLDFEVEVFGPVPDSRSATGGHQKFETLGEHLFIQLKGCLAANRRVVQIDARHNVEKSSLRVDRSNHIGEIEVIAFSLEVTELVTVQRMGAALPVLLVVADLDAQECFFVCLNDYIDKILVPAHDDYASTGHRVIHIPTSNRLSDNRAGLPALRWYAKRAKLYAAFQKFIYQEAELSHGLPSQEFLALSRHFASLLVRYDFWDDIEVWEVIAYYGAAISRYLATGAPGPAGEKGLQMRREVSRSVYEGGNVDDIREFEATFQMHYARDLWRKLAVLPRVYEEVCREWYLPSPLGVLSSLRATEGPSAGEASGTGGAAEQAAAADPASRGG